MRLQNPKPTSKELEKLESPLNTGLCILRYLTKVLCMFHSLLYLGMSFSLSNISYFYLQPQPTSLTSSPCLKATLFLHRGSWHGKQNATKGQHACVVTVGIWNRKQKKMKSRKDANLKFCTWWFNYGISFMFISSSMLPDILIYAIKL